MKSLFFVLIFIIGSCVANPISNNPILGPPIFKDDASDAYVDKVLENLRQMIAENGLDPADLPDGEVGFSQDIGFITLHGSAKVYDGFFQGFSFSFQNHI